MPTMHPARQLWSLFEPIHAVTYFTPQARAAFEEAGLRGFWRGYFAGRAAPLGAVDAAPVYAAFFSFARPMVERALPDVWTRATPEAALAARLAGARAALQATLADADHTPGIEVAADLLRTAAERVEVPGRVLAAANAALPWPDQPIDVLWHATTILREHRGDGHVAALVSAGLDPVETSVWRTALGGYQRDRLQPARGWTDEQWADAAQRLTARGWLDGTGQATDAAREVHVAVEASTDRLAIRPWDGVDIDKALAAIRPLAVRAASLFPYPNPIGLPDPRGTA